MRSVESMPRRTGGVLSLLLLAAACAAADSDVELPSAPPDCGSGAPATRAAPHTPSSARTAESANAGHQSHTPVLRTVADVPLPGPAVRFDYQSLDTTSGRLYIAHMNAGQLVVFDVNARRVVANLDGFDDVHGVWAVPERDRVYAAVTGRRQVAVVDASTLKVVARVGAITYPDGIAYAPAVGRVYVSDEHGKADAVIDAHTNTLLKSIPLGGEAGNTAYDPGSGCILVAVSQRNELAAIKPGADSVIGRYAVPGVEGPHGVTLDVPGRLAFVAGEGNAKLAVVDLRTMRVVSTHAVGDDPDVLAFDPVWKRLYVSAESGTVVVFTERDGGLVRDGELSMPHAHTVAVDPRTHLVYFPLQNLGGRPVLRIMEGDPPANASR
jgi:DNA-binding beta-propeller fold protein YncE